MAQVPPGRDPLRPGHLPSPAAPGELEPLPCSFPCTTPGASAPTSIAEIPMDPQARAPGRSPPLTCGCGQCWLHGRAPLAARQLCCLTPTHAPAPCLSQLIPLPVLLLLLKIPRWLPALPCPSRSRRAPRHRGCPRAPPGPGHRASPGLGWLGTIPCVEGTAGPWPCCGRGRAACAPSWGGKRGALVPLYFIAERGILTVWGGFCSSVP